jgi:uroporphyrinogen decarboxylase
MVEKRGPWFPQTVRSESDLKKLRIADGDNDLKYVIDAIQITKKNLNGRVPLIGFAGAPWTIFAYMIEGSGSKTFSKSREMLYRNPSFSHQLLDMITDSTINYLKAQIRAGADLVQIFDSWAGILGPKQYLDFSLSYISRICDAITEVPVTVFAKGAFFAREEMGKLNCATIGLDWNMGIEESRDLIGPTKTLQGNLDPAALYGNPDQVRQATNEMMEQFRGSRHIANLGHGVYPDIDPEKVKIFIQTVKDFS